MTRTFDVFFDLRLNKRLSKQSRGWWFETESDSLWRRCNGKSDWPPKGFSLVTNSSTWGVLGVSTDPMGQWSGGVTIFKHNINHWLLLECGHQYLACIKYPVRHTSHVCIIESSCKTSFVLYVYIYIHLTSKFPVRYNLLWWFGNTAVQSPVDSPYKRPLMLSFDVFLLLSRTSFLKQQPSCRWFETSWHGIHLTSL